MNCNFSGLHSEEIIFHDNSNIILCHLQKNFCYKVLIIVNKTSMKDDFVRSRRVNVFFSCNTHVTQISLYVLKERVYRPCVSIFMYCTDNT